MKFLKLFSKLVLAAFLVISLTLNIALLVGGTLYQVASSAFGAMTGIRTLVVEHADEVAQLGGELAQERAAKKKLSAELAEATRDLSTERVVTKKLRGELSESASALTAERLATRMLKAEIVDPLSRPVVFRGKTMAVRDAVDVTTDRISKRAVVTSSREVGAMAGEAIPYIGTAVIVGVTALELKDLCDTLKDMGELQRAFSLETATIEEETTTVCSQRVPTGEELWELTKNSPKVAWSAAMDAVPTLDEIKNYELPDVDWTAAWSATTEGTGKAWGAAKHGAASAVEKTKSTASGLMRLFIGDDTSGVGE